MRRVVFSCIFLGFAAPVFGQNSVDSFTLINADDDSPIAGFDPIAEGATINLNSLPSTNVNIRANTTPDSDFGSVKFQLSGETTENQTESVPPWALWGDSSGDYNTGSLNTGSHTLTATPYDANNGGGNAGTPLTITFTVTTESSGLSVSAGPDETVNLPTDQVTLNGSATDDGSISSLLWTQVSGPGVATLSGETTDTLTAADLIEGTYIFRLTATDNDSNTASDDAQVFVVSQDPVADAGPDQFVVLPTTTANLDATGSTDDGTIDTFAWTQVSGPNTAGFDDAASATPTVSGLIEGTYVFEVTVTDNLGGTDSDQVSLFVVPDNGGDAVITGELKKWHKVTLSFLGPETNETADPNPFTDYRLDVTFNHAGSGKSYTVPGYYAADGNAEDTGATGGNIWRVHFAPDEIGTWTYSAGFRSGTNVATSDAANPGSSAGFFDGSTGTLEIDPTDKSGRDFRGKGRLSYVGGHYLQFEETGEYFLKQGADAPENFLAYEEFDGPFKTDEAITPKNSDKWIKDWAPHITDWNSGDPTWAQVDGTAGAYGKGIIGAINYLASEGMNVFSFLPMNIGGDDQNVFPYLDYNERERLDVSRLAQWEVLFAHATQLGMFLHFKTQETENELLLDGGDLGDHRKLYYRELIARFGHHLALNWNLGEEINNASTAQKQAWAQYFRDTDPYDHHIVIHNGANHYDLLGSASELTGFSLQTNNANFSGVHSRVKNYLERSVDAGKPWAVACDEPGDAQHALRPDDDAGNSHVDGRKNGIWGTFLAGGWGNEWYFGYAHDQSDLTCNDFRSRDNWWDYCRYALEFFQNNNVPYWEMTNDNGKSSASDDYCFYKEDDTYLVYLKNGGTTDLDLSAAGGEFLVRWYDPRNGGLLQEGTVTSVTGGSTVSLGNPPVDPGEDWLIIVQRPVRVAYIHGDVAADGTVPSGAADPYHQMLLTDTGNLGLSEFKDMVEAEGYLIEQHYDQDTTLDAAFLNQFDVVVFGLHQKIWSNAEKTALDTWLRAGGGAVGYSDSASGGAFNQVGLSNPVGQNVFNNLFSQYGLEITVDQGGGVRAYISDPGESNPIVSDQPELEGEGVSVVAVDPASGAEALIPFDDANKISGSSLSPSSGGISISNPLWAALALQEVGSGHVIALFDRQMFWNNGPGSDINERDNKEILRRIVRFLAGDLPMPADIAAQILTESLPGALLDTSYSFALAGNGDLPLSWQITGLPPGLSAGTDGVITGTPSAEGDFSLNVTLTDSDGDEDHATFPLAVSRPPVAGEDLLFDDFNEGTLTDWTVVFGNDSWTAQNNNLAYTANNERSTIVYTGAGSTSWQDYILNVDFDYGSDDDIAGILFYYQDHDNYLAFWMTQSFTDNSLPSGTSHRVLEKKVDGERTILAADTPSGDLNNQSYQITIRIENGGQTEVLIDDAVILSAGTPAELTAGSIGFYTHWLQSGSWDDVRVSLPAPDYDGWAGEIDWNGKSSLALDDANNNGWVNLWQFWMNLHPALANDPADLPKVLITNDGVDDWLTFEIRERIHASGVGFSAETSPLLNGWNGQTIDGVTLKREVIDPDVDGDGATALVRYKLKKEDPQGFLRFILTN